MMRIYELPDYDSMSRRAANIISAHVLLQPSCTLGLATGSTPLGIYRQLIRQYEAGDLSLEETRCVNLDEYLGLGPTHPQSYRYFMQKNFFDHININPENTHVPDGLCPDADAECARYNQVIKSLGGVDLQLLGLGHNGHIGFNEPGRSFELGTHLVDLSESTINANTRFFKSSAQVPHQALTMGIKNIMEAKQILVVVSGADKADIVRRAFAGPVSPDVPCSILQMHRDVILVGDTAALSELRKANVSIGS